MYEPFNHIFLGIKAKLFFFPAERSQDAQKWQRKPHASAGTAELQLHYWHGEVSCVIETAALGL